MLFGSRINFLSKHSLSFGHIPEASALRSPLSIPGCPVRWPTVATVLRRLLHCCLCSSPVLHWSPCPGRDSSASRLPPPPARTHPTSFLPLALRLGFSSLMLAYGQASLPPQEPSFSRPPHRPPPLSVLYLESRPQTRPPGTAGEPALPARVCCASVRCPPLGTALPKLSLTHWRGAYSRQHVKARDRDSRRRRLKPPVFQVVFSQRVLPVRATILSLCFCF